MNSAVGCQTIARLYAEMAKTDDPVLAIIWKNAAKRWWFYRRIALRLGRDLRFDETEKLHDRCRRSDLFTGTIDPLIEPVDGQRGLPKDHPMIVIVEGMIL